MGRTCVDKVRQLCQWVVVSVVLLSMVLVSIVDDRCRHQLRFDVKLAISDANSTFTDKKPETSSVREIRRLEACAEMIKLASCLNILKDDRLIFQMIKANIFLRGSKLFQCERRRREECVETIELANFLNFFKDHRWNANSDFPEREMSALSTKSSSGPFLRSTAMEDKKQ